jgi:hypothetical protein
MAQIKCTTCNGTGWVEVPDPPVGGYTISGKVGLGTLTVHASDRFAGAIDSVTWMGKEFIDCLDHGREMQSASSFDDLGESWNPTEAGSNMDGDGTGPTSTSKLLEVNASGNVLKTKTQMAFWMPVGDKKLSDHILTKTVTIGHDASDHVIQHLVNFKVTEAHGKAKFEALTGYMPAEFKAFYSFDPARSILKKIGHGGASVPVILSTEDGKYAMGCYCPECSEYGTFDADHLLQNVVKWNMVFRQSATPAGNYPFRCYSIIGSLENVRVSLIQLYRALLGTPAPVPEPDSGPTPITGEIVDFNRDASCDGGSCYFTIGRVNGVMNFGEYGYQMGQSSSSIFAYPHTKVQQFDAESVFDICLHKEKYYLALERGGRDAGIDRGMVFQLQGTKWVEVFRHPTSEMFFNLHSHSNYIYVTAGGSVGGVYRSTDGVKWETFIPSDKYCRWDMDTLDGHIYFSGAYGGDYGPGCIPAVWKDTERVWDYTGGKDGGFLGIAAFKGDIYTGMANPAKVCRLSTKSVVLDKSSFSKIPKLVVDKSADTLFALLCKDDQATSGAKVWATKDGSKWYQINGPWSCPHLFAAYYDEQDKAVWIGGGRWGQNADPSNGRIYKSIRG